MLRSFKTDFSDCTPHDFNHYFSGTLMVWRLTSTKQRIINILQLSQSGEIEAQYLTREGEWVHKVLAWNKWWDDLFAIPHSIFGFNTPSGCIVWKPNTHNNSGQGKKKSIKWGPSGYKIYGDVPPSEQASQAFVGRAFPEIYKSKFPPITMRLAEALGSLRYATVTPNFFTVDRTSGKLGFKGTVIGTFAPDFADPTIFLKKSAMGFKTILMREEGIPENKIKVQGEKAV